MQTLILGCGYIGTAFGLHMLDRGSVTGTCRTGDKAEVLLSHGIIPIIFEGSQHQGQNDQLCAAAARADVVLACVPPGPNGDTAYLALKTIFTEYSPKWIGYLSTTGVYGDRGGGWAFEDDVLTPASVEAKRRVTAEASWRQLPRPAHIFRLPGIYGPGRSALEQVLAGTARRIDKAEQVFSRAHRDDIVSALLASSQLPNPGRVYNICDDYPCPSGDVIVEACRLLNRPPPPLIAFADAKLSEMGRRFYAECKRVPNARIKSELAWRPSYPRYYEGLQDCFKYVRTC